MKKEQTGKEILRFLTSGIGDYHGKERYLFLLIATVVSVIYYFLIRYFSRKEPFYFLIFVIIYIPVLMALLLIAIRKKGELNGCNKPHT